VIAHRGKMPLASEIAISSSAQVALLVTPLVMLVSLAFAHPLALTFRWIELAAMGGAAVFVAAAVADARSSRREGFVLVAAYVGVAAAFFVAGDR
jgi:Ca2+:H+ antiporter